MRKFVTTYVIVAETTTPESDYHPGVTPEGVAQIEKEKLQTEGIQRIAYAITDIQVNTETKK